VQQIWNKKARRLSDMEPTLQVKPFFVYFFCRSCLADNVLRYTTMMFNNSD